MADNHFSENMEALFKGLDGFVSTKTVVGEPMKVDGATILPLIDVTCGMAAGAFADNAKNNGGGGMSAKMSPSALLVIQNGSTRLIHIKNQDAISKVIDMAPDLINRITGKHQPSAAAVEAAEKMADEAK